MKKISGLVLSLVISLLFITACNNIEDIIPLDDYLISVDDFEYDEGNLYMTVSNDTEVYSFINKLTFIEEVVFSIASDINGNQIIQSKIINLDTGDNLVYVLAKINNDTVAVYNATIRRRSLYEITFSNDVVSQIIEEDDFVAIPEQPTKAGYVFDKWLYNETEYDFNTPVISNMNINVKWIANSNTLIFDGNGATSGSMDNQLIDTDDTENLKANTYMKYGYSSCGWSTTEDGEVEYVNQGSYTMGPFGSYTLYAVWGDVIRNGDFEDFYDTSFPKTPKYWSMYGDYFEGKTASLSNSKYGIINTEVNSFNQNSDKYRIIDNPGTTSEIEKNDTYILMLNNNEPSAIKYKSHSLLIPANVSGKLTLYVKTLNISFLHENENIDGGANIRITGTSDPITVSNINTEGEWIKYEISIDASEEDKILYLELGLGIGSPANSLGYTSGYVFFDNVKMTYID